MDKRPLSDERLTWKAKGILAYLLSKPDDWQIWVTDLVKRSKDGEHAVRTGLQELMEQGYATRKQERNDEGKYETLEWTVHEQPLGGFPQADKPDADKPDAENHQHTNNDSTNNEGGTEKEETNRSASADFLPPPEDDYSLLTPIGRGEYVPGPGKLVSCVDPDTDEEVGEPSWRFPQGQVQNQAFEATGRIRFSTRTEWNKLRKIERMLDNGELPYKFWEAQIWCATNYHWKFPVLLKSTLNPDRLRDWEAKQKGENIESSN
jgi:hypothetical protein